MNPEYSTAAVRAPRAQTVWSADSRWEDKQFKCYVEIRQRGEGYVTSSVLFKCSYETMLNNLQLFQKTQCYCNTANGHRAYARSAKNRRTFNLTADCALHCEWILCFCVIALIGEPMQRTSVFHLRARELLRQRAGYLLPKASAVTTCIQPNLVRHEICITLKLMFYYVTHYEYYITWP